jgi:hypothetical protein
MAASRIRYLLPVHVSAAQQRLRDKPVSAIPIEQRREISPVRLVGYFVGGILLANLILMTSAAFRGQAAAVGANDAIPTHGPVAAAAAERTRGASEATTGVATEAATDVEPAIETVDNSDRPSMANLCADAREKLITGLTLYYLERSRRPNASAEEVMESTTAHALLSGPADPGAMPTGIPCGAG